MRQVSVSRGASFGGPCSYRFFVPLDVSKNGRNRVRAHVFAPFPVNSTIVVNAQRTLSAYGRNCTLKPSKCTRALLASRPTPP